MLMIILNYIFFSWSFMFIQCESSPCRSITRPGECCLNFYKADDGSCQECPSGTHGLNCSLKFPPGYFGLHCVKECNCSNDACDSVEGCIPHSFISSGQPSSSLGTECSVEIDGKPCPKGCKCSNGNCDPLQGCSEITTAMTLMGTRNYVEARTESRHNDKEVSKLGEQTLWKDVSYILIGSMCTVVALVALFCLKSRLQRIGNKRDMENNDLSEVRIQQEQPLAGIAYTPRTETVDEENQYDDLRSSRMIEMHTEGIISEDRLFPNIDECLDEPKNGQGNVSINHLKNEEWTVNRHEEQNEYGHFSDTCQYSVLSLRRNMEPDYTFESSD